MDPVFQVACSVLNFKMIVIIPNLCTSVMCQCVAVMSNRRHSAASFISFSLTSLEGIVLSSDDFDLKTRKKTAFRDFRRDICFKRLKNHAG